MAFKLSKDDCKIKDDWAEKLREQYAEIVLRGEAAHEAMSDLNDAINDYNATLADVQAFVDGIREAWQEEHDDKSEKWQEGEKAEYALSLISDWEALDLSEVETFDLPSAPEAAHADALDALPSQAEG